MIASKQTSIEFLCAVLDSMPVPVFVVDEDVRISMGNAAAKEMVQGDEDFHLRRGGELLRCINAVSSLQGCGKAASCGTCVIRNAVKESCNGQRVVRRMYKMKLVSGLEAVPCHLLVTAAPLQLDEGKQVLLILEDISEMVALRNLVPICAFCKKIRADNDFWEHVESYFQRNMEVDFSHGICPECLKEHYPEYDRSRGESGGD